ncbi:MAG: penicillin-binding protein activator LpoB [Proteobacteria bacterium]|nr:penicillin-binding protein activator LpoB [Pseudomonadota bacterium]
MNTKHRPHKLQQWIHLLPYTGLAIIMMTTGCTTFSGEYADPESVELLDESWNETDARQTATNVIKTMLTKPWLKLFKSKKKQRPIVVVGNIQNRTDEHIDTEALVNFISDELINSGEVRFVDAKNRQAVLKEIAHQQQHARVAQKTGNQLGAHMLLTGTISSYVQTQGTKRKNVTYQTQVTLTDLETTEIVWSHKEDIKKRFKRSALGL